MTPRPLPAPILAGVLACVLASGPALAAETGSVVKLDAATQTRLGVAVAPLAAERRAAVVTGFARVLDPSPLAQLDSDIAVAAIAAEASRAEAVRARALNAADATVSTRVAEAAEAAARGDAAKLALLRRRLGLEWGPTFQRMSDAARSRLVAGLAGGTSALVRIDVAGFAALNAASADLDLGPAGRARATILGPARTTDPRLQSTGLIGLVTGAQARLLATGFAAPASLAGGASVQGVVLPRSALLRNEGRTLVYVRKDPGSFELRAAEGGVPIPSGLFVPRGFAPGEAVVVQGASALHAAQNPPAKEEE